MVFSFFLLALTCKQDRHSTNVTFSICFFCRSFSLLQNHRVIQFGWDLWRKLSPIPLIRQVAYSRSHRQMSRSVLNISREEDYTAYLASLFQHHPQCKEVLPCVSMELPAFQFLPIAPCYIAACPQKKSALINLTPILQIFNSGEIPPQSYFSEKSCQIFL